MKERWTELNSKRAAHLERCRVCAALTIPAVLPKEGWDLSQALEVPWQGHGFRCCSNLASRLNLTLFPPNSPFFRLDINDGILNQVIPDEETRARARNDLVRASRSMAQEFEAQGFRRHSYDILLSLVVVGNKLIEFLPEGGIRTYRLDQYVVRRAPDGSILELIIKEQIPFIMVPEAIRGEVMAKAGVSPKDLFKTADLYTYCQRTPDGFTRSQFVNDIEYVDGYAEFTVEDFPYIPLRWSSINGEDYGRGQVELTLGDWNTLEALVIAGTKFSSAAARVVPLVNPAGLTDIRDIITAPDGVPISGRAEDVTFMQLNKMMDMEYVKAQIAELTQRLSYVFLVTQVIQRNAERVTATELRMMAQELETAYGGVYSLLAEEIQKPIAKRIMKQLVSKGVLPAFPKELSIVITTGLEALGRGNDLQKIDEFIQRAQLIDPERRYTNTGALLVETANAIDLPADRAVKSVEAIEAEQMAQQQQMLNQQIMPEIAKAAMNSTITGGNNEKA